MCREFLPIHCEGPENKVSLERRIKRKYMQMGRTGVFRAEVDLPSGFIPTGTNLPQAPLKSFPFPPIKIVPVVCVSASRMPSTSATRMRHVGPLGVIPGHPNPLPTVPLP